MAQRLPQETLPAPQKHLSVAEWKGSNFWAIHTDLLARLCCQGSWEESQLLDLTAQMIKANPGEVAQNV